jgi:hypothetical protein
MDLAQSEVIDGYATNTSLFGGIITKSNLDIFQAKVAKSQRQYPYNGLADLHQHRTIGQILHTPLCARPLYFDNSAGEAEWFPFLIHTRLCSPQNLFRLGRADKGAKKRYRTMLRVLP